VPLFQLLQLHIGPCGSTINHPTGHRLHLVILIVKRRHFQGLLSTTVSTAQLIQRQIFRNPKQPSAKRALPRPLPRPIPYPQKHFLRQIISNTRVSHHSTHLLGHLRLIAIKQKRKSL
jgi:hypothetical protein